MSKRLQVLVDEAEWRAIRRIAKEQHQTVAEWVRGVMRAAFRQGPSTDVDAKQRILTAALRHEFPTGSIEQLNEEIARGYENSDP